LEAWLGSVCVPEEAAELLNPDRNLDDAERKLSDVGKTSISSSNSPHGRMPLSPSFHEAAASLPAAKAPMGTPVLREHLPDVSVEFVRKALWGSDRTWPVQIYLEQEMRAHDIKATPWAQGRQIASTNVRRLQFQMPVPADVPSAVKRLISLPEETRVTLLARIGTSDDGVVLLQEIVSHDVAYGNDFVVQEVMSFRVHPEGGVLFEKFAEVRWVAALPWYAGVVRTFVEMRAKSDGKTSGSFLASHLRSHCTSVGS
jgi:hypothetical protein